MRVSPEALRTLLDEIDELDEALEIGGRRRRGRRRQRRAERKRRRAQRLQRRASKLESGRRRGGGRKAGRQAMPEGDGAAERSPMPADPRQNALTRFRHQDQELAMPEPDQDQLDLDQDELEALMEEDIDEAADITDDLLDEELIMAGRRRLRRIAGAVEEGQITPRAARRQARGVHRGVRTNLRAWDGQGPERRAALRRNVVQRLQGEISGFHGDVGCAACSEAYGQALTSGLLLAGRQAEAHCAGSEFGFIPGAGKKVRRAVENIADKFRRDPSKVAERRARRAGRRLQTLVQSQVGPSTPTGRWGPDTQVAPDLMMRAQAGRQGAVLDLGGGVYLVASLPAGQVARDPHGSRRQILRHAERAVAAKLSPVGLLPGA